MSINNSDAKFKPRARLILLLGDELIRDATMAAFELVKNSYDADATNCIITLHQITEKDARISILDDGCGMSLETIRTVWLEPGTSNRKTQRQSGSRTPLYKRMPLGEKGVGRFAVHKLGRKIVLTTRAAVGLETVVRIDWDNFHANSYLEDVPVHIEQRPPQIFSNGTTGTLIEVTSLSAPLQRGDVRRLYRSITSICSPFDAPDSFNAGLALDPDPGTGGSGWLEDLESVADVLAAAPFKVEGTIVGDTIDYSYEFTPPVALRGKVPGRSVSRRVPLVGKDVYGDNEARKPRPTPFSIQDYGIGEIGFSFHVYDLDPKFLALVEHGKAIIKKYLETNGGVRVYRDGIRVYDYGEPGNDWLNLGNRRANVPVRRIGNNQVIGAVSLSSTESTKLIEKTNREGFVESTSLRVFRAAVLCALSNTETERNIDKALIREASAAETLKEPVIDELAELRELLKSRCSETDFSEYDRILVRVSSEYVEVRDTLLSAAAGGMNLILVVHEIEKEIQSLAKTVDKLERNQLKTRITDLSDLVDGVTWLLRKSSSSEESAHTLLKQTVLNNKIRFRAHEIEVFDSIKEGLSPDFSLVCFRRLVMAAIGNLVDNAIYWLNARAIANKCLYLGTSSSLHAEGASIIVADNGPGFGGDNPYLLMKPGVSRKEDGMGFGLHIVKEVMKNHEGAIYFPERADAGIPKKFSGAVVELHFPRAKVR